MRKRKQKSPFGLPLLLGSAAIAAAEVGRRMFRHTQVFCPSPDPVKSWDWTDYGIPKDAVEEHWIETPDGEQLYAWYCRAPKPVASGVFCHGNTGNLTISADVIPHLLDAGFNVLFFDYRGFGKSTGRAGFRGVISDGVTASRFHDKIRPQELPSVLYGFSLGGAVAAQVILRHPFDGLILQSTFTNLAQLSRVFYPRLPLHLFAGRELDTLSVINRLQVPLLIVHGSADEVCPSSMANALFDACTAPKKIVFIEGALHKDIHLRDPDALIWAISQFIAELPRNPRTFSVEEEPVIERWTNSAWRAVRRLVRRTPQQA